MAGTPPAAPCTMRPHFQPDQKAIGQHDCHHMPMKTRPQTPLIVIPTQFPVGFFMELLYRIAPMGIADQLVAHGRGRQVTSVILPVLRLTTAGPFPQQPADMSLAVAGDPPAAHGHKLLPQPSLGLLPPTDRPPLPMGQGLQHLIGSLHRTPRFAPSTHPEVRAHPHHIAFLSRF
jgi:hypothetical protein